jgi:hypothetical protein
MITLSATQEELEFICYELNTEITQMLHRDIWIDFINFKIQTTFKAFEKIMYYLEEGYLKTRLQAQFNNQVKK